MKTLLRYIMPIMLLASCTHSYDKEPNFHVWNYEYNLVSMQGHEAALQRDKDILGPSGLEKTTATMVNYWNGDIDWVELNIGDCVRYRNTPGGPIEAPHRCTELVEVDGVVKEYAPYISASKNFMESIAPNIAEIKQGSKTEVVWSDIDGKELARFRFKKEVE